MSKCMMLSVAAVITGLVSGCANPPWQPPAYESAMKRYYEAHASEKNGRCLTPEIDGFTTVQVVEDRRERIVVDARYLYRDRRKEGNEDSPFNECIGYGQRRFVLAQIDDRLQVIEMSGLRRN
jgi:hypothetical protein